MKGYWDREFEPSVEEIVDYPMIFLWRFSQFAFSSELVFRAGDFPIQSRTWQVKVNRLKPRAPSIRVCGACAVCRRVLVRIYGGYFS